MCVYACMCQETCHRPSYHRHDSRQGSSSETEKTSDRDTNPKSLKRNEPLGNRLEYLTTCFPRRSSERNLAKIHTHMHVYDLRFVIWFRKYARYHISYRRNNELLTIVIVLIEFRYGLLSLIHYKK